jgi:hypothetical protein
MMPVTDSAMASIDPANQINALVRTVLARRQKTLAAGKSRNTREQPDATRQRSSGLEQLLLRRIHAVAADDPDRRQKVFRAFLEANLLAEFGEQLANAPEFAQMVSEVQAQMEGDPRLASAIDEVVKTMLDGPA